MSFVCLEKCLEEDLDSRLETDPNVFAWKKPEDLAWKRILQECLEEHRSGFQALKDPNVFAWKKAWRSRLAGLCGGVQCRPQPRAAPVPARTPGRLKYHAKAARNPAVPQVFFCYVTLSHMEQPPSFG